VTDLPLDRRLDQFAEQLDVLAARATRTVADLRRHCHAILADLAECEEHFDLAHVDAELARMNSRDELRAVEGRFDADISRVVIRIVHARDDAIATLLRLQDGVEAAARDVARRVGIDCLRTS
jgi:hypothetical protein